MKIIIIGCGRVGSQAALLMVNDGHDVTVIDNDARYLARLGPGFRGKAIRGLGFDRSILLSAGIEQADAVAAVSQSDNLNIVAARIARNIFRVPRVVARLYDPRRAEIYQRLGLLTISTTTWGAERVRELLSHPDLDPIFSFGSGEVSLLNIEVPSPLVGRMVKHLTIPGEMQVVAITRRGHAILPLTGTEFVRGDLIHLAVLASSMERAKEMLGLSLGG